MNYNKIFEKFIQKVMVNGTYATKEEIEQVVYPMLEIVKQNVDKTPEEMIDAIIVDNITKLEEIHNHYPVPGYMIEVNVANIRVKLYGGTMDNSNREMKKDALFDIASMTKFYTELVAYNLIKEGVFQFSSQIKDLDSRFVNVGNLTMGEVLNFAVSFQTNGRLSEKSKIEDALDCLYTMNVVERGKYNYNDMGMMLVKEVMESVTGKSYEELLNYYIFDKLNLKDTHLVVPNHKIENLTGSANASLGKVNDPSALSVGGYSGHAGIFASSDDLIKVGRAAYDGIILPSDMQSDMYTPGIKENRGIMGNTYTSHKEGIQMTYVDRLDEKNSFAVQGSTRVQLNVGKNSASTILLNPASMSIEQALEEEEKINENRRLKGLAPVSFVKKFIYDRNGKEVHYRLVDARQMVPSGKTMEPLTTENVKLSLRLQFLNEVMKEYDHEFNQNINVEKHVK